MKKNISLSDVLRLSVSERIQFVEDVWDSLSKIPDLIDLTEAQKKELDLRTESYFQNPSAVSSWAQTKKRILKK